MIDKKYNHYKQGGGRGGTQKGPVVTIYLTFSLGKNDERKKSITLVKRFCNVSSMTNACAEISTILCFKHLVETLTLSRTIKLNF